MGIVYFETCDDCNRPKRRRNCSSEDAFVGFRGRPDTSCFPPIPPNNGVLAGILRRLAAAEANIAQNTALIEELLARVEGRIGVIREFFEENEGETVTVVATFDVIEGVVETVGTDVIVIVAPNDDIFIIPYTSIITVATGEQGGL